MGFKETARPEDQREKLKGPRWLEFLERECFFLLTSTVYKLPQ